MNTKLRTLRGVILATFLALIVTVGGAVASSAVATPIIPTTPTCTITLVSGDPATAPPAPTCYDPSGNDLDEFLVPYYVDANGNRVSYDNPSGNSYWYDRPNPTNGASQVPVQSSHYDPDVGMYVDGPAWQLDFNTSVTATPTPNTYWVTMGKCTGGPGDWTRDVNLNVRNDAGADGRYIGSIYPEATGNDGGITVAGSQPFTRLYDGSTAAIPLIIDQYTPGLLPGFTYKVKVWLTDKVSASSTRTLGAVLSVWVPKCGTSTGSSVRPRASIVVLKRKPTFSRAKVVLGSDKATQSTKYRVIIDPKRGRTVRKTFNTMHKVLRYGKIRKETLVKVRFGNKVVRKRF